MGLNQAMEEADATAMKCNSKWCGCEQGRGRELGHRKREAEEKRGRQISYFQLQGTTSLAYLLTKLTVVAVCDLKHFFPVKLKIFPYPFFVNAFFFFFLALGTDR